VTRSNLLRVKFAAALRRSVFACLLALAALAAPALAQTTATLLPSLHPNRRHALAALTMTVLYSGGQSGIPQPVRRATLRFPAGMGIEIPALRTCTVQHLRNLGARGCPAHSQIGSGHALAEVQAGSQIFTESIALSVFLGAPRDLQPTVEVLGQGYSPFDERLVFTGTVLPDSAPYGEKLEMSIPAIPSVPLEPDVSIVELSLTVGARAGHAHVTSAVVVPSHCPLGGLTFAAEFTYADGSSDSVLATTPCPL
jgi:hypothetical protein